MFKFTISPRNTEKILDKLSKKFEIFDAEKSEEKVTFTCHNKDRKKIKKRGDISLTRLLPRSPRD